MDEKNEIIYFSGNKGNHTERHLFMSSFSIAKTDSSNKGRKKIVL